MNDNSLKKLKILWEKLDNQKVDDEENQNEDQNSLVNSFQRNFNWVPPNFAKLSVQDYNSKTSKFFSMAYNEEERIKNRSPNVNWFFYILQQLTCLKYWYSFLHEFNQSNILN